MDNPALAFPVMPWELVVAPLTDVELRLRERLGALAPSVGLVELTTELTRHQNHFVSGIYGMPGFPAIGFGFRDTPILGKQDDIIDPRLFLFFCNSV